MSAKTTGTVKFKLDPKHLPRLAAGQKARLEAIDDSKIDFSDIPPLGGAKWTRPDLLVPGANKSQITLRIDSDVLAFFRSTGSRYQTRMNAVLRAYMAAQEPAVRKRH